MSQTTMIEIAAELFFLPVSTFLMFSSGEGQTVSESVHSDGEVS